MDIVNEILRQSALMILWVGSVAGMFVGGWMWFKPQQLIKLNQYFSHWVGSEKIEVALDRPRWTERFFYRHHRLVGFGVLVGALGILYTFLFRYNLRTVSAIVHRDFWWLSDALMAMLLVGSLVAAIVGVLILTRPSMLREIEAAANKWVSTERFQSLLNKKNFSAELALIRHHRIAGASILAGSFYVLIAISYLLLQGPAKP